MGKYGAGLGIFESVETWDLQDLKQYSGVGFSIFTKTGPVTKKLNGIRDCVHSRDIKVSLTVIYKLYQGNKLQTYIPYITSKLYLISRGNILIIPYITSHDMNHNLYHDLFLFVMFGAPYEYAYCGPSFHGNKLQKLVI